METTLYTSCGRCRKPILLPSAGTVLTTTPTDATTPDQKAKLTLEPKPRPKPAGNYAYCLACKQSSSKCSIWSVLYGSVDCGLFSHLQAINTPGELLPPATSTPHSSSRFHRYTTGVPVPHISQHFLLVISPRSPADHRYRLASRRR